MEIEGEDGTKTELKTNTKTIIGRGKGILTKDKTVSRRHVELYLHLDKAEPLRASFEVTGMNPVWVLRGGFDGESKEVRVFRKSETGHMAVGDWICVSGANPVWFKLRRTEGGSELGGGECGSFDCVDVSDIDPVKDFGFIRLGQEFDIYPKNRIKDPKKWDWFLEERGGQDSDEDDFGKRRGGRRKRKKVRVEDDDDDWSDENEDDKVVFESEKVNRPKYMTRSKDQRNVHKKDLTRKKSKIDQPRTDGFDDEDEDDETLGGFIVNNDEGEDIMLDEIDEEEEFIDDDEDDDTRDAHFTNVI